MIDGVLFSPTGLEHYFYWQTQDRRTIKWSRTIEERREAFQEGRAEYLALREKQDAELARKDAEIMALRAQLEARRC